MKYIFILLTVLLCTVLFLRQNFNVYRGYDTLRFNVVCDLDVPVDEHFPIYIHEPSACDFCPTIITKMSQDGKNRFFKHCHVKMDTCPARYGNMHKWELDEIQDIIHISRDSRIMRGGGILHDAKTNAKINLLLYECESEGIMIIIPAGNENEEARERYKHHDYAEGCNFFSWIELIL